MASIFTLPYIECLPVALTLAFDIKNAAEIEKRRLKIEN